MRFYACLDDGSFLPAGEELPLSPGGWTGARPGIFCLGKTDGPSGYADFKYVRFSDYDPKETAP